MLSRPLLGGAAVLGWAAVGGPGGLLGSVLTEAVDAVAAMGSSRAAALVKKGLQALADSSLLTALQGVGISTST